MLQGHFLPFASENLSEIRYFSRVTVRYTSPKYTQYAIFASIHSASILQRANRSPDFIPIEILGGIGQRYVLYSNKMQHKILEDLEHAIVEE